MVVMTLNKPLNFGLGIAKHSLFNCQYDYDELCEVPGQSQALVYEPAWYEHWSHKEPAKCDTYSNALIYHKFVTL